MIFNPDASKQAQEVIFDQKIKKTHHLPLVFNNAIVSQFNSQKTPISYFKECTQHFYFQRKT